MVNQVHDALNLPLSQMNITFVMKGILTSDDLGQELVKVRERERSKSLIVSSHDFEAPVHSPMQPHFSTLGDGGNVVMLGRTHHSASTGSINDETIKASIVSNKTASALHSAL